MKTLLLAALVAVAIIGPTASSASAMTHGQWIALRRAQMNPYVVAPYATPVVVNPYMYRGYAPIYRVHRHARFW